MKKTMSSPNNSHVALVAFRRVAVSARTLIRSLPIIALTILLMAWTSRGQSVEFSDCFTNGSTLNSTNPAAPANISIEIPDTNSPDGTNDSTSYSTSYEIVSSGTWSPTPSISSGNLDFGLASSSSYQNIQVQALFGTMPVSLACTNDYIQLVVTFTDKKSVLTNSAGGGGYFNIGLFNSGSDFSGESNAGVTNFPVAGGLNGKALSTSTSAATGWAQNWVGYSAQIANTGVTSRVNTRAAQSGTGNNNQDVLLGSGLNSNKGYANPGPNISHSPKSTVVLTNGQQYTVVLTLTATAVSTNDDSACAISNSVSLYAGVGTSGAPLTQYGINETGTNFTTNEFDAFAIGWYENQTNVASEIDISQITVTACQQSQISKVSIANSVFEDYSTNNPSCNVYIADPDDNIVYAYIDDGSGTNAVATIVAGSGIAGYSGDGGAATNASLNYPCGVAVDQYGYVYIADTSNNVVRIVDLNGNIGTIAGNGIAGYSGDGGMGPYAELNHPCGVAVDDYGYVYIADSGNNVVRWLEAFNYIFTIAGNGTAGYSGDGGPATNACLNAPAGIEVGDMGNNFTGHDFRIYDQVDNVIREVDTNGVISTVAGSTNSIP